MANVVLLILCLVAGALLRRTGRFPESTPAALNGFVIHLSLPAAAILHIHSLQFDSSMLFVAGMAWLLFGVGWLFFHLAGNALSLPRRTVGALVLTGGLGNTSFVGLPMIEAYYGRDLLGVGILADQLGSFMVLSSLGILAAALYSSGSPSPRQMVRKVVLFPPFQALVLAVVLRPVPFPDWTVTVLKKLADTITPLALASVGFQLRFIPLRGMRTGLALGLGYKLLLGPLLIALLYLGLLGLRGPAMQVTIFEAAMAPMITAGIIAMDHDLDPPLLTMMLGIGIPLSFATLPVWAFFLKGF
ncbi:AEC family transporter [Trichlorobacter ammonificans]|uniref:Malate permease n=1 Tax=Trichlorobacter ammonificans TaxID=2916410 RepID=A0ABN8HC26_9BACT|nr:AEC family transporter [Trichlorobacter ammonificans]CAH2030287.1 Malate permease [Trichlorobacter ammonificans]